MATKTSIILRSTLQKKTTVLVKPSKRTPHEVLSLSTLDNDPANELMNKTLQIYEANNENGGKEPVSLLKEALARVLVYYYPFAGKVRRRCRDGRLELICNGDGVPFVIASIGCSLSEVNYLAEIDLEAMAEVLLPGYGISHDCDEFYHPLALQVTRFSCGGFTLGVATAHPVSDGAGHALFSQALVELASGMSEPLVKPVWERERLVARDDDVKNHNDQPLDVREVPVLGSSPYMQATDIVSEMITVTAGSIKTLRAMVIKESKDIGTFTTFEVLCAFLWRARTRAMEINPDETTLLDVVLGVWNLLEPPLPEGYYGNAVIDVVIPLKRRDLDELPLCEIAKLIKKAKKTASNYSYVQDELRNTERRITANMKMFEEDKGGAAMMVTDLRKIDVGLRAMDFGWKRPVDGMPVDPPDDVRLCTILSPSRAEGGARVIATLPRAAMRRFKREMETLNKLDSRKLLSNL